MPEKKVDWGDPPRQIFIDGALFDLREVMSKCYPYHPVHLRWGDLVFELQLIGWNNDAKDAPDFSRPPTPATRLASNEEMDELVRRLGGPKHK
jgi:hypothetical protein